MYFTTKYQIGYPTCKLVVTGLGFKEAMPEMLLSGVLVWGVDIGRKIGDLQRFISCGFQELPF